MWLVTQREHVVGVVICMGHNIEEHVSFHDYITCSQFLIDKLHLRDSYRDVEKPS
jgi:hypothetical protein